jgi:hypothetical protein
MDRDQAFAELTASCPSFAASGGLPAYVSSFEDEHTPDVFVRTTALAHHVVERLGAGDAEEVAWLAGAVDRVLAEGDGDARELVVVGFLEPLRNIVSHPDVGLRPDDVAALLGPAGAGAWRDNETLWAAAAEAGTPNRRVTAAEYDAVTDPQLRRYLQAHRRRMADGTLAGSSDVVRYEQARADAEPPAPAPAHRRRPLPWGLVVGALGLLVIVALLTFR